MDTKLNYINSEDGLKDLKDEYKAECEYYDRMLAKYPEDIVAVFTESGILAHVHVLNLLTG